MKGCNGLWLGSVYWNLDEIIDKYAETPNENRNRLVREALKDPEQRKKLAEAMMKPIRDKLHRTLTANLKERFITTALPSPLPLTLG